MEIKLISGSQDQSHFKIATLFNDKQKKFSFVYIRQLYVKFWKTGSVFNQKSRFLTETAQLQVLEQFVMNLSVVIREGVTATNLLLMIISYEVINIVDIFKDILQIYVKFQNRLTLPATQWKPLEIFN